MPAQSQAQQRLMGMVHAYKKGKLPNASEKVKSVARHIKGTDAEDFAKTKHEGLPERKEAQAHNTFLTNVAVLEGYGLLKVSADLSAFRKRANFAINCALLAQAGLLKSAMGAGGPGGSGGSGGAEGVGGQGAHGMGGELGMSGATLDARRGTASVPRARTLPTALIRRLRAGGISAAAPVAAAPPINR